MDPTPDMPPPEIPPPEVTASPTRDENEPMTDLPPETTRRPWPFPRSDSDRILGGVASGLATRLDVDASYVRIALVGITLFLAYNAGGGAEVLVTIPYLVAWIVLPSDRGPGPLRRIGSRRGLQDLGLAGVAFVLGEVMLNSPASIVIIGLTGIAAALLADRPTGHAADAPVSTGDDDGHGSTVAGVGFPDAVDVDRLPPPPDRARSGPTQGAAARALLPPGIRSRFTPTDPETPGAPRQPRRRARREPALGRLTFALLFLLVLGAVALDQLTGGGVDPRLVVDLALLIVGGILVLSRWRGRAGLTALALVVIAPMWLAFSVADVGRFDGIGTRTAHPTGDVGHQLDFEVGYGSLDVDLRDLTPTTAETVVRIGVTGGRAHVTVPADAAVVIRGRIGLGGLRVDAPDAFLFDGEPATNRSFDRRYPALGAECATIEADQTTLARYAVGAGLITEDQAVAATAAELLDAIEAAGHPRPTFSFRQPAEVLTEEFPDGGFDDMTVDGAPVTESPAVNESEPDQTGAIDYFTLSVSLAYLRGTGVEELCTPTPPPADPHLFIIEPTIGLGSLEVTRV